MAMQFSLDFQVQKLIEIFREIAQHTGRTAFPLEELRRIHAGGHYIMGTYSFDRLQDGFSYLKEAGKIRLLESGQGVIVELTEKFKEIPKTVMTVELDREISNRYQMELKRVNEAHAVLYDLENKLREFVKSKLESLDPSWLSNLVEKSIREDWESKKKQEDGYAWLQVADSHPIYYSTIEQLVKIIKDNENWEKIFKNVFARREIVLNRLSELEIVRRIISHNREVSDKTLAHLKAIHDDVMACLR